MSSLIFTPLGNMDANPVSQEHQERYEDEGSHPIINSDNQFCFFLIHSHIPSAFSALFSRWCCKSTWGLFHDYCRYVTMMLPLWHETTL